MYSDANVDTASFFEKADVYDHYNEKTVFACSKKPAYRINVALDHKENLLEKAKRLDFYDEHICHNANDRLPFDDCSFNSVFSNILYWLDSPKDVLGEICRILKPGGKAAFMLPDSGFIECSFYNKLYLKTSDENWKWLEKIDRGRVTEHIKHMYDAKTWEGMFESVGLKVSLHKRHLSRAFISMWDIGLRPLFPVLHKMQSKLSAEDRLEIKKEWIDMIMDFALPILESDLRRDESECVFHYYVVEKAAAVY